ncbi:hemagglutinin repeat-containing protein, partial [Acinetobacter faecalis]|uniref:two-partner secretion domain-containing protein n=1 Tax=Acinetobacter faecalis TaxID=2665161 RepID=UPI002A9180F4
MNKNFYKTIFSKTRGEMVVVAENVSAEGQTNNQRTTQVEIDTESTAEKSLGLKVLSFSIMLLTGVASISITTDLAQANVVADPNAAGNQRPTIINSANGTPQVNIQTPSKAGVSMNHYQQFDVNQKGVILNNSRQNTQTQLAGHIQANPWLAGGEAKVIVNQVNSSNPSHLNGYIEVGGRKADVIIANPTGINVDGGGFINAGGVTLTTGNPLLNNGVVTGFQVRDGLINITGQGLDTSKTDYTRLLSHAAQINAGVWAKDLQVVAGQNDIDANNNIRKVGTESKESPKFSIDTGSLGGMYAGKISLISTDKGVGINNAGQVFSSAGSIKISADGQLQNSGSVVAQHKEDAKQATLDIQATDLKNSGSISSLGKQSIQTTNLNNTGLIATSAELNIRNKASIQNQGEINAGRIDIETKDLKNSSGKIIQTGLQDLAIDAKMLNNKNKGLIGYSEIEQDTGTAPSTGTGGGNTGGSGTGTEAPSTATGGGSTSSANTSITASFAQGKIKADSIENDAGKITANGGVDLTLNQGLDNSDATLNLNTLNVKGQHLKNNQGVVTAQDATVKTRDIDNTAGKFQVVQHLSIESEQLKNTQGQILAGKTLSIGTGDLNNNEGELLSSQDSDIQASDVQNTAGKILANQNVAIDAKSITADGQLSAGNDLKLKLKDSFTTKNKIEAGNNLKIETAGNLVNTTELQAGSKLELKANDIDNKDTGRMIANNGTHIKSENLTNRGEINSNGQTLVELTNALNNIGTGRIYGNHVAISANKVINQEENIAAESKAAVIAARDRLDLAAKDIVNKENALISSEGNMAIAGALDENKYAVGQAQSINNNSAKIEAGADLAISSQTLRNTNEHLKTEIKEVDRQHLVEYEAQGQNQRYTEGSQAELGWSIKNNESDHMVTPDGKWHENWHKYDYEKIKQETQVVNSAPGQIIAGGNIKITGDSLLNSDSQILAGGVLDVAVKDLDNHETLGQTIVTDEGVLHSYWRKHKKGRDTTGHSTSSYRPAPIITDLNLGVLAYQEHVQALSTTKPDTQLNAQSTVKNDITVRTLDVNTSLPNSSLFNTNPNNPEYLIETDPAFTNYKKWLGSDYMLNMLTTDSQNMHKRLGDGYYEQKLITQQISQLTGRRFLDGFNSNEEQFQQLMRNGVTAAQSMQLKVGIALSPEQIANLTSDIVWLVEQQVTLADGRVETVLAPQVYVRLQAGDINGNGALLAGSNTSLNVENSLVNSGIIAGRNALVIQADSIQNLGGRLTADKLSAKANKDITNVSGMIDAKQQLFLDAGENINIVTSTNTTQNNQGSNTHLNRQAGVYVTDKDGQGILALNAGKDIQLNAGVISNASEEGITQLTAKNDINLGTTQVSQKQENIKDANNYIKRSEHGEIGSQIQAQNNIQLNAGNDINLRASEINSAQGNVIAQAENINVKSGEYTKTADDALKTKSKGFASTTTRIFKDRSEQTQAVSSVIGGQNISLNAEKDISVKGSHVIADQNTVLNAKQDVRIEAATTTSTENSIYSKKKSGLFSSGGLGVTLGSIKESTDQTGQTKRSTASSVGSLNGNTHIVAGKNYQQTGSNVSAVKGDVNIVAQQVNIEAAAENQQNDYKYEREQKGLTLAVNVPIVSAIQTALNSSEQVGQSKNDRVNAMSVANAGFDAYKAGQSIAKLKDAATSAQDLTKAAEVSVSLTYGQQKEMNFSHTDSTTGAASQVNAGGQVNVVATGAGKDSNINIIGSDVIGKQGTHLTADNDINIQSFEQNSTERSGNKSSGFNAGITYSSQAGFGITAGGNLGKGSGNGDETSHLNSHVGSQDSLTTINSGNATNIIGGQVQGKGVQVTAKELNIESLQDKATYKAKQENISGQFSVGTGGGSAS